MSDGIFGFLLLLFLGAVVFLFVKSGPEPSEEDRESIRIETRCRDRVVCFHPVYSSKGFSCLTDTAIVNKYCPTPEDKP